MISFRRREELVQVIVNSKLISWVLSAESTIAVLRQRKSIKTVKEKHNSRHIYQLIHVVGYCNRKILQWHNVLLQPPGAINETKGAKQVQILCLFILNVCNVTDLAGDDVSGS